ncbi:N-acetyllactosaminide beta-1,3-N-acetylglucosaminyltransferase 2 [Anoplopoma fimbria]|uniref:N-acetyllactosaminide beta-1,3-N-acetylglucosaminyltransferase 2 n=1 Tax=Anoplopoma fimbria TaxID=229290 RepID=UPI0023EB97E4|nr:N-acetyllactosaminide beta-1,3-N-acetylglucosaminyltransferase 2 [Anoplopoma fimbria]
MACCFCRWRAVLICVCTPFISLVLLFAYATVMLCMTMNNTESTWNPTYGPEPVHFVAPGTLSIKDYAPLPKTFWELLQHGDTIWNRLQLTIDRHFNPILRPNNIKRGSENGTFYESLLQQAISEVTNLEIMRENFDQLPQQIQDFVSHMHRRNYPTLIQPDRECGAGAKDEREAPLLLLAIKSIEQNFEKRQVIRKTWGQTGWVERQRQNVKGGGEGGGNVRRVFLLAKGRNENVGVNLSESLQMESERYGDILQWDFMDTFFNLTLKDVLFWSWFSHSCNRTLFVFKGDDDVFVNTPRLMTYLRDQLKKPQANETMKDFMIGDVLVGAPNRDIKSKYFVPESFYKGLYPMYVGGGGVVYSSVLTKRLYHMSKRVHMFPIDDVYVGMCMIRLNIPLIHHPAFLTLDFPNKEEEQLCSYHTILLVHKRSPTQVVKLWADMKMTQEQCWDVPLRGEVKKKI